MIDREEGEQHADRDVDKEQGERVDTRHHLDAQPRAVDRCDSQPDVESHERGHLHQSQQPAQRAERPQRDGGIGQEEPGVENHQRPGQRAGQTCEDPGQVLLRVTVCQGEQDPYPDDGERHREQDREPEVLTHAPGQPVVDRRAVLDGRDGDQEQCQLPGADAAGVHRPTALPRRSHRLNPGCVTATCTNRWTGMCANDSGQSRW